MSAEQFCNGRLSWGDTENMVFKSRKKGQSKNIWREGKKTVEEGEEPFPDQEAQIFY
jgi:hypothetical protein